MAADAGPVGRFQVRKEFGESAFVSAEPTKPPMPWRWPVRLLRRSTATRRSSLRPFLRLARARSGRGNRFRAALSIQAAQGAHAIASARQQYGKFAGRDPAYGLQFRWCLKHDADARTGALRGLSSNATEDCSTDTTSAHCWKASVEKRSTGLRVSNRLTPKQNSSPGCKVRPSRAAARSTNGRGKSDSPLDPVRATPAQKFARSFRARHLA